MHGKEPRLFFYGVHLKVMNTLARYSLALVRIPVLCVLFTLMSMGTLVITRVASRRWGHRLFDGGIKIFHWIMGVQIRVIGTPPTEPVVLLCNHPSYFDIFFTRLPRPTTLFIASEFRNTPLMGWLASSLNAIWVDRQNPLSKKLAKNSCLNRLKSGISVILFPEGKTTASHTLDVVHPGMFYTAEKNDLSVAFLSIQYAQREILYFHDLKAGFIRHLSKHLWKLLLLPRIPVTLRYSSVQHITDAQEGMKDFYRFQRWHNRHAV